MTPMVQPEGFTPLLLHSLVGCDSSRASTSKKRECRIGCAPANGCHLVSRKPSSMHRRSHEEPAMLHSMPNVAGLTPHSISPGRDHSGWQWCR